MLKRENKNWVVQQEKIMQDMGLGSWEEHWRKEKEAKRNENKKESS